MPRKRGPKKIQKKSEKFNKPPVLEGDEPEPEMLSLDEALAEEESAIPMENDDEDF